MGIELSLTQHDIAGLQYLVEMAQRGREDLEYQAGFGDYSQADVVAAEQLWQHARETAQRLVGQIHGQLASEK